MKDIIKIDGIEYIKKSEYDKLEKKKKRKWRNIEKWKILRI